MWYDNNNHPVAYYHESTLKAVKAIESFFKDVFIVRSNKNGTYGYRVPIRFEGKESSIQMLQTPKEKIDRTIGETLPMMSLGFTSPPIPAAAEGLVGDPKLRNNKLINGTAVSAFAGSPFTLSLELTLRANLLNELVNMYETIMSRLMKTPVIISMYETNLNFKRDIKLSNISVRFGEYNIEANKGDNTRPLEYIISFNAGPVYFYPPFLESNDVIKHVILDYSNTTSPDDINLVNRWDVVSESAEKSDDHVERYSQETDGNIYIIIEEEVDGI